MNRLDEQWGLCAHELPATNSSKSRPGDVTVTEDLTYTTQHSTSGLIKQSNTHSEEPPRPRIMILAVPGTLQWYVLQGRGRPGVARDGGE